MSSLRLREINLNNNVLSLPADRPRLTDLRSFDTLNGKRIDIAEHIAPNSEEFGICLLDDVDGVSFTTIEGSLGPRASTTDILSELFRQWLAGRGKRPETWATFVNCLRIVRLNYLADSIETVYEHNIVNSPPSNTITKPVPAVTSTPSVQTLGELLI